MARLALLIESGLLHARPAVSFTESRMLVHTSCAHFTAFKAAQILLEDLHMCRCHPHTGYMPHQLARQALGDVNVNVRNALAVSEQTLTTPENRDHKPRG